MPRKTGVKIKAGNDFFDFLITDRDWKILHLGGIFLNGAARFIRELGLYDNHTVREGTAPGSKAERTWMKFYSAVVELKSSIEAVSEFLVYDYTTKPKIFPKTDSSKNMFGAFRVFGMDAGFSIPSPAQLTLELYREGSDGKIFVAGYLDVRSEKSIQTEQHGEIKILRKKKETDLADVLERLDVFLSEHQGEEITIYHN